MGRTRARIEPTLHPTASAATASVQWRAATRTCTPLAGRSGRSLCTCAPLGLLYMRMALTFDCGAVRYAWLNQHSSWRFIAWLVRTRLSTRSQAQLRAEDTEVSIDSHF
jgi:hypothetical protein